MQMSDCKRKQWAKNVNALPPDECHVADVVFSNTSHVVEKPLECMNFVDSEASYIRCRKPFTLLHSVDS